MMDILFVERKKGYLCEKKNEKGEGLKTVKGTNLGNCFLGK